MQRRTTNLVGIVLLALACCYAAEAHPAVGIVVTPDGTIYFVHGPSCRLYRMVPGIDFTVHVEGSIQEDFRVPHHLILRDGALITASDAGNHVWRIMPDRTKKDIFPHAAYTGDHVIGAGGDPVSIDPNGNIIAMIPGNASILRIKADGSAAIVAGGSGRGHADGRGGEAKFGELGNSCIAWTPDGAMIITDNGTQIRRVTMDGDVTTIVDHSTRQPLTTERSPRFEGLMGVAVAPDGTIYAADAEGRRIWKVGSDGNAAVFAGTGARGKADGPSNEATFEEPVGIAVGPKGDLFVVDYGWADNRQELRIRQITSDGVVSTIAETRPEIY